MTCHNCGSAERTRSYCKECIVGLECDAAEAQAEVARLREELREMRNECDSARRAASAENALRLEAEAKHSITCTCSPIPRADCCTCGAVEESER